MKRGAREHDSFDRNTSRSVSSFTDSVGHFKINSDNDTFVHALTTGSGYFREVAVVINIPVDGDEITIIICKPNFYDEQFEPRHLPTNLTAYSVYSRYLSFMVNLEMVISDQEEDLFSEVNVELDFSEITNTFKFFRFAMTMMPDESLLRSALIDAYPHLWLLLGMYGAMMIRPAYDLMYRDSPNHISRKYMKLIKKKLAQ